MKIDKMVVATGLIFVLYSFNDAFVMNLSLITMLNLLLGTVFAVKLWTRWKHTTDIDFIDTVTIVLLLLVGLNFKYKFKLYWALLLFDIATMAGIVYSMICEKRSIIKIIVILREKIAMIVIIITAIIMYLFRADILYFVILTTLYLGVCGYALWREIKHTASV